MKIFIDENGDVGFKEASSEFFCVALVIFYNDEALYDFREKMITLRRLLKMKSENEFHYSHLPKKTKYELINTVTQCEFEFYGIIIQKRKLIAHSKIKNDSITIRQVSLSTMRVKRSLKIVSSS